MCRQAEPCWGGGLSVGCVTFGAGCMMSLDQALYDAEILRRGGRTMKAGSTMGMGGVGGVG